MSLVGLLVLALLSAPACGADETSSAAEAARPWPGPRRSAPAPRKPAPRRVAAADVAVSVELELSDRPGEWRDAVADLGRSAGFRHDPASKTILRGEGTRASVRGWLPVSRMGEAASHARVRRLETEGGTSSETDLLVGLRLPEGLPEAEFIAFSLERLREQAGFEAEGTLGIHRAEDGRRIAVVSGGLPVRGIRRLLADPAVVRVAPYVPSVPPAPRKLSFTALTERPILLLAGFLAVFSGLLGLSRKPKRHR